MGETRPEQDRFHRFLRLKCDSGKDNNQTSRETSIGPFNNIRDLHPQDPVT